MARRSADERGEPKLLMVAPGQGAISKRKRYVPVADLLEREGRPLDMDEDFLVADAVQSVRKGMTRIAVGLLAVVGAATVATDLLTSPSVERPLVDERREAPRSATQTPTTVQDVVRAAKKKSNPAKRKPAEQQSRPTTRQPAPQQPAPQQPAPQPAPEPDYQEHSGNYGQDYSGDYGREYWDWNG